MPTFPIDPNLPETVAPAPAVSGLTPTLRERIERGAAWLDRVRPDWRSRIDLATLDLGSGYDCVLGQVYNDEVEDPDGDGFDYAIAHVVPVPRPVTLWLAEHGFEVPPNPYGYRFDYKPLTTAWRAYLQEG